MWVLHARLRQMTASPSAKFLAGGTNLVDLMRMDVEQPAKLIDISRLPLDKIEATAEGGLRIGALVQAEICCSEHAVPTSTI